MFDKEHSIETEVQLNKFKWRSYQLPLLDALENKKYKRAIAIWPRRCLSGDSHILMHNGSYKLLKALSVGDLIASWDGEKIVTDKVKNVWSTGIKQTWNVRTSSYLTLAATEDHFFATTASSSLRIRWERTKDIGKNRQLLNFAGMPLGKKHDPDLAEFIGYLTSDGYISGYQQPKFTNTNKDILERVAYLAKKLFDYDAIWREKGKGFDLGLTNGTKGGGGTKNQIKELFRAEHQDVPKSRKRLLSILWEFDELSLGRFFAAVISSDGNLYMHKNGFTAKDSGKSIPPSNEITLNCGKSDTLGWDIYWLLRKLGIVPQVPYKERCANWKVKISKNIAVSRLLSFGEIYGKEEARKKMLIRALEGCKETKKWNGCYRGRAKVTKSQQEETYDLETETNHNYFANGYLVHNSGKDVVAFNWVIRCALRKIGVYFLVYPTYSQGRKILWDSMTNDGQRFLDFIPDELIESTNSTEMKIRLKNQSLIQVVGSDNYSSLVGTNPCGIVFSEYALQDPRAYQFLRPVLTANFGWAIFISTPRGKNSLYELYQIAISNPDHWYCSKLTVNDTGHIALEDIQREKASGEMSEDLIQQEYFTSFEMGVEGAYYAKYIDKMKLDGRIGIIPYESGSKVNSAWDIGVRDSTSIILFQLIGQTVRVIDYYENSKVGLEHYVKILEQKAQQQGWIWGKHFAPHDIAVREFGTGMTRIEKAKQLGISFTITPNISIEDGIEAVRSAFNKFWIDENKCKQLIKCLENYRQEWDEKKKVYKSCPLHNQWSHGADSFRYLVLNLPRLRDGLSPEDLDKRYREAMYGSQGQLPAAFRDPNEYF